MTIHYFRNGILPFKSGIAWLLLFFLHQVCVSHAQSNPPYPVIWVNPVNVNINGSIVTKNVGGSAWSAGANSSNLLQSNSDGWVEFVGSTGSYFSVGLAVNNLIDIDQYSYGILLDQANNSFVTFEGATSTGYGAWQAGDVFRISREGNSIKYYRNGTVIRTVSTTASMELRIKTVLRYAGKSTSAVTASFDGQLILQSTVSGLQGNNLLGSISVGVTGGTPPYTYNWSSGELTSSITNKAQGLYSLTVNDASGRTSSKTYNLGYKINWINKIGVSTSGDILTKTANRSWRNSCAITSNVLPANTDGWLEFSAQTKSDYLIGFSSNNWQDYNQFENAIYVDVTSSVAQFFEGSSSTGLGYWNPGDVFKISREGNLMKYYRNNILLRTTAVNPALVLKVKVSILEPGHSTPNITTSFDGQLVLYGSVIGTAGNNLVGSISLSVDGGAAPYTYDWSTGEESTSIIDKPQGIYSVTVSDAVGRSSTRAYSIGYRVNWINNQGVSVAEDVLTKNINPRTWNNSGAISSNVFPANMDGWMEFSISEKSDYIIGLASNAILDYSTFDNCIQIEGSNNTCVIYEGSTGIGFGHWQGGDIFRIAREGSTVNYFRNGVLVRSITVNPSLVLKLKVTIQEPGFSTPNINTSFDGQLFLQAAVTGTNGNTGSGGIAVSVSGGSAPYTYTWSSGENTNSITNKQKGSYTLTVSDAVGRMQTRTYALGYRVDWTNKTGVSTSGDILTKTHIAQTWTSAGAVSSNSLSTQTDGWIEFYPEINGDYIVGLATNNVIDQTAFTYGIRIHRLSNQVFSHEGTVVSGLGVFMPGDVFSISRIGNQLKYFRNGEVIRTLTVPTTLVLKAKVAIQIPGRSSPRITSSFWSSDGIVRTYYAIDDGNWTTPSIWSLSENGPPSTVYPDDIDKVVVKGHEVIINNPIKSAGVTITSTNDNTRLKVDGSMGVLTVRGNVVMNRDNDKNAEVLIVANGGRLEVKN